MQQDDEVIRFCELMVLTGLSGLACAMALNVDYYLTSAMFGALALTMGILMLVATDV